MSVEGKLRKINSGHAAYCPGCNEYHIFDKRWTFDGNYDAPTFTPSLLVRCHGDDETAEEVCHSFLTAGNWQFLGDCTHHLAGQTIAMKDEPEDWTFAEERKDD